MVLCNQIRQSTQINHPAHKSSSHNDFGKTTLDRAKYIYKNQGVLGFYRGILPGSQSIFFRNGASMLVMQYFNRVITERGWRE